MSPRKWDGDGASEIVGALMLTLIVVVAAASFSVFVSQKQKDIQQQQALDLRRSLEQIHIFSLVPEKNIAGTEWAELNFTVASVHSDTSRVTRMAVNGYAVKEFGLMRYNRTSSQYETTSLDYHDRFEIGSLERLNIIVTVPAGLFDTTASILVSDSVSLEIDTYYLNAFSRAFIPPTAIARIITEVQWDGTDFAPFIILDAASSTFYGEAYAVSWSWTLLGDNDGDGSYETGEEVLTRSGVKAAAGFTTTPRTYQVTLEITDSNGMTGSHTFTYDY